MKNLFLGLFFVSSFLCSCQHYADSSSGSSKVTVPMTKSIVKIDKSKIKHVLVIYLENHSFYNLFAQFPGADNEVPKDYQGQIDGQGKLYKFFPQVCARHATEGDPRFPKDLKNETFLIDQFVSPSNLVPDPTHEFFTHQVQLNNGLSNKFVAYSAVGALPMGYYDMKNSYLWKLAQEFVLADQFYQSAFGGSFLNHQWLIAAQTPFYPNAPSSHLTVLGADGLPTKPGSLTPDGYAVNSIQPNDFPFEPKEAEKQGRLPPLKYANIGDRLSEKNISWVWYAGGWNSILKGKNEGRFQHHHQPFLYFKKYGPGSKGRQLHLKDEEDLMASLKKGILPAVSFYKPVGVENAHPGYSDVTSADSKVRQVVETLQKSSLWENTLVVITFDEHGGFWDPKAPQKVDRWGLGSRIPAIFVAQNSPRHLVDHTHYETTSILAFIEKRFGIKSLTDRDRKANPFSGFIE